MKSRDVLFIRWILFCTLFFMPMGESMALEEAKYTVIMKEESFELRQYESHIVAKTIIGRCQLLPS